MTNRPSGNGATIARRSEYADNLAATEIISRANFDAALGPLKRYIEDPLTTDVNVNPDDSIWISRGTHGKTRAAETMNPRQRETLIGMLANRAGSVIDRLHSRLATDLPYYPVRVQCFAPPIGGWALCLRPRAAGRIASEPRRHDVGPSGGTVTAPRYARVWRGDRRGRGALG